MPSFDYRRKSHQTNRPDDSLAAYFARRENDCLLHFKSRNEYDDARPAVGRNGRGLKVSGDSATRRHSFSRLVERRGKFVRRAATGKAPQSLETPTERRPTRTVTRMAERRDLSTRHLQKRGESFL